MSMMHPRPTTAAMLALWLCISFLLLWFVSVCLATATPIKVPDYIVAVLAGAMATWGKPLTIGKRLLAASSLALLVTIGYALVKELPSDAELAAAMGGQLVVELTVSGLTGILLAALSFVGMWIGTVRSRAQPSENA